MDGQRFDDLARRLAETTDRRRLLGLGLGAVAGGVLSLFGDGAIGAAMAQEAEEVEASANRNYRRCRQRLFTVCNRRLGGTSLQTTCKRKSKACCRDLVAGRRCTAFR